MQHRTCQEPPGVWLQGRQWQERRAPRSVCTAQPEPHTPAVTVPASSRGTGRSPGPQLPGTVTSQVPERKGPLTQLPEGETSGTGVLAELVFLSAAETSCQNPSPRRCEDRRPQ